MRVASPATAKRNSLGIISPIDRDSINNDEPTSPNTHIEDYKHQLQKAERFGFNVLLHVHSLTAPVLYAERYGNS